MRHSWRRWNRILFVHWGTTVWTMIESTLHHKGTDFPSLLNPPFIIIESTIHLEDKWKLSTYWLWYLSTIRVRNCGAAQCSLFLIRKCQLYYKCYIFYKCQTEWDWYLSLVHDSYKILPASWIVSSSLDVIHSWPRNIMARQFNTMENHHCLLLTCTGAGVKLGKRDDGWIFNRRQNGNIVVSSSCDTLLLY